MLIYLQLLDTERERTLFTALYEKYRHFLWYLANQILQDESLAEDAVHEAYLTVIRYLDQIEGPDCVRTRNFLETIVRSRALDLLRRRKHVREEEPLEDVQIGSGRDGLDVMLRKENEEALIRAIDQLSEENRQIVICKYLFEMSSAEIGDIMNLQEKTVNVRLFRARKQLQELLKQEVWR